MKPSLAAFPKCFMDQLCVHRTMTLVEWIELAAGLGVDGLEFYSGFIDDEPEFLTRTKDCLAKHGLQMPMLCCSPDFTQPDPSLLAAEIAREKRMIEITAFFGGRFCRVLSGQRRPGISRQAGVAQVVKVFVEIVSQIESPWFGVNYDPSNAILAGEDPLTLLAEVKDRVVSMHASDRSLKFGTIEDLRKEEDSVGYASRLSHGVIGQGLNDYDQIFSTLSSVGFDSWISIEDGMNGMDDLRESVRFLRSKIAQHFSP